LVPAQAGLIAVVAAHAMLYSRSIIALSAILLAATGSGTQPLKDKAAMMDALLRDYDRADVPGASVIVIREGKVLFKKGYGSANLEEKVPAAPDTNYRIASVTKQFTAMAIMILAERKKLSYDDPLTRFFPDLPAYGKSITLRQLLNHTSGLIAYEDVIPKGTVTALADEAVVKLLEKQDQTYFPPGSKFRYSNSGYALLGQVVERASGTNFKQFLHANIFEPLQMANTKFYDRDDRTDRRRAYGYTQRPDKSFARTDQSLTSSISADGSLYTSVDDLYRWDQALYTSPIVSAETLRQTFSPGSYSPDRRAGYGFGWFLSDYRGLKTVWHGGMTVGFHAAIKRIPDRRFTVIILSNRTGDDHELFEIVDKIADLYLFAE
jgi:CubicO group peptidase (beta-lactamase class C family)